MLMTGKPTYEDLESELYKLKLLSRAASNQIEVDVNDVLEEANKDRKQQKAIIEQLLARLDGLYTYMQENSFVLPDLLDEDEFQKVVGDSKRPVYPWGEVCIVWSRVWVMHTPTNVELLTVAPMVYPGDLEATKREFANAMLNILGRQPILEDVGKQSIPGLTSEELLEIARSLTPYKYVLTDDYNSQRLEAFNKNWEKIDRVGTSNTKDNQRKYFKTVIDNIFDNAEHRRRELAQGGTTFVPPQSTSD